MLVYRCDNCKKIVKEGKGLALVYRYIRRLELCKACADPIIELISKQRLLPPRLIKKLQTSE
jgi:DNA-directed RNA polymerase subunit RPC12/RpoP